jgi:tetratricopeptide (TPR) repeat protein
LRYVFVAVGLMSFTLLEPGPVGAQTTTPTPPPRVAAAPKPGPSFEEVSRKAAVAREGGKVPEALLLYQKAVRMRPKWAEGWWYLATLQYEGDRFAESRESFRRFLALKPDAGPAWALRGLCDYRVGDFAAALEHLNKGLALGGSGPEILRVVRYHQALLLVRARQFELAVLPFTLLARSEPESLGLVEPIGLMLLRKPLFPADIPESQRGLVRAAGRAGYLHLARKGTEAAKAFADLVAAHPDEPWVHYVHGVFLMSSDSDKGLAELRRETELQPQAVYPHLEIAFELLRRGDNGGARVSAEAAVKLAPDLFAARNALGRALVELGELEPGILELEEAARLAPDSPEMHFSLARAYQKAGRTAEAEKSRATFTELDRKRRAERGEGGASDSEGPGSR